MEQHFRIADMSDRQLVTRNTTNISHASEAARAHFEMCARDLASLHDWQRRLEADLVARLQQQAAADPSAGMKIQQRAEECFQALMAQGVERIENHVAGVSASASKEIEVYKERVATHMEERLQAATARAHAAAQAHAEDLRNENQLQIEQSLQLLIDQASSEATALVVSATQSHLESAGHELTVRSDDALRVLNERFENTATDRIKRLLKDAYSGAQLVLQSFADDQVSDIRRRVQDHVSQVVREVRINQENEALSSIRSLALEEARLLSRTVEQRVDEAFRVARDRHAKAIASLEASAESRATDVQQSIQRQVQRAWENAEASIKRTIATELTDRLASHCREMETFVQERVIAALATKDDSDIVQERLKRFIRRESAAQSEAHASRIRKEMESALKDVSTSMPAQVAQALAATTPNKSTDQSQLALVREEVKVAVQDLDVKITEATRMMAKQATSKKNVTSAEAAEQQIALIRNELATALRAMDAKMEMQASRMSAAPITEQIVTPANISESQNPPGVAAGAGVGATTSHGVGRGEDAIRHVIDAVSQLESKITKFVGRNIEVSPARTVASTSAGTGVDQISVCDAVAQTTPVRDESADMEEMMQRAWDEAIEEEIATPVTLRSLQQPKVRTFLSELAMYWQRGGKKPWTSFLRPGLLQFIRTCELDDGASEAEVLVFLERHTQRKVNADPDGFAVLFSNVAVDLDATTATDQAQSVLLGVEEAIASTLRTGILIDVPLNVYIHVVLEKLPEPFRAALQPEIMTFKTKKAFTVALMSTACKMD